jgi:hypothetical protein
MELVITAEVVVVALLLYCQQAAHQVINHWFPGGSKIAHG